VWKHRRRASKSDTTSFCIAREGVRVARWAGKVHEAWERSVTLQGSAGAEMLSNGL